jgi:hypothetical protein
LGLKLASNKAAAKIAQALPELRNEFARGPDEVGLCQALQLEAAVYWNYARSAAVEDACERAAEYARRSNDRRQLAEVLGWLASAALWGPTPGAEGIRRGEGYLDEIANHPRGEAVVLLHMAGLYATQDKVEIALDLAQVLAVSGRVSEAHAAATQALDLYQRKGNLPGARESLRYLTQYVHTRERIY